MPGSYEQAVLSSVNRKNIQFIAMQSISHDDSTYMTKPGNVSLFSRTFPSLNFYPKFAGIIYRASRAARTGTGYGDDAWGQSSLSVMEALEKVGVTIQTTGLSFLKKTPGPVIFVGNHLSVLETVVLPAHIIPYKPVTFVVKESLIHVPVFKYIMRSRNPIVVTRTNPRHDLKVVLDEGCDRLSRGVSIIVFPQTTRAPFNPEQFSTIAIKLARKADVPVIPLALLTDAWENGRMMKDFGRIRPARKVYFAFGEPMKVEGKGHDTHQAVIDFIQENLALWQGGDPLTEKTMINVESKTPER